MDMEPLKSREQLVDAEARQTYEPPAVAWEEPFDPVAASCCQLGEPGCSPEDAC
jgi:hypothetical protein